MTRLDPSTTTRSSARRQRPMMSWSRTPSPVCSPIASTFCLFALCLRKAAAVRQSAAREASEKTKGLKTAEDSNLVIRSAKLSTELPHELPPSPDIPEPQTSSSSGGSSEYAFEPPVSANEVQPDTLGPRTVGSSGGKKGKNSSPDDLIDYYL